MITQLEAALLLRGLSHGCHRTPAVSEKGYRHQATRHAYCIHDAFSTDKSAVATSAPNRFELTTTENEWYGVSTAAV
jgi:hypothetical protein